MIGGERVALVTGASRGIGLEAGRQLLAAGFTVMFGARDQRKAEHAVAALGAPDRVIVVALDVTDAAGIARARAYTHDRFGRLDVLVNNAAIMYDADAHGIDVDLGRVRTALETNLFGAWRMTQHFVPLLRRSEHARVVNVSSEGGSLAGMGSGTPAYSISKAALNALTRIMAAELAEDRILVNAVCPGWTATEMGGGGGRPIRDGAASVVWGALLPDDGPSGGFFRDGRALRW